MKLLRIFFIISLWSFTFLTQAQTIIPLERGKGGVRAKSIDDYKEDMKIAERQHNNS